MTIATTRSLRGEVKLVAPVKRLERLTHKHTHTHKARLIETFTASHKPSWHHSIRKLGPIRMGATDKRGWIAQCDHFVSWRLNSLVAELSSGIFGGTIGSSEASYAYCRLMLLLPISRGMRMEFKSHFSSLLQNPDRLSCLR